MVNTSAQIHHVSTDTVCMQTILRYGTLTGPEETRAQRSCLYSWFQLSSWSQEEEKRGPKWEIIHVLEVVIKLPMSLSLFAAYRKSPLDKEKLKLISATILIFVLGPSPVPSMHCLCRSLCPQALHWAVAGKESPMLQAAAAARTYPPQKFSEGCSGGTNISDIPQQLSYMILSGSALLCLDQMIFCLLPKSKSLFQQDFFCWPA